MTDSWRNPDELPLDWMPLKRATQKINRNDPCPCGSGKKYKKCCEAKDAARSKSPYAGMTMDEAMRHPGRHGDPRIIEKIPEEMLGELELETLAPKQLQELARRFGDLDRWDEAERALSALGALGEALQNEGIRVDDMRAELVRKLLVDGKPEKVAAHLEKIQNLDDPLFRAAAVSAAALQHQPDVLARLDELLRVELEHGVCMLEIADMLRWGKAPALALTLLRAACFEGLGEQDLELLAEDAAALRSELELEGQDPVVTAHLDLLDRKDEEARRPDLIEEKRRINESLLRQLNETRDSLRKLEEERQQSERSDRGARPGDSAPGNDTVDVLRRKVDELKAEIRVQQGERRELKQRLRSSEESAPPARAARGRDAHAAAPRDEPAADEGGEVVPETRPLRPIVFSDVFYKSLTGMDPRLVVKAQESALRFAAYDPAIWHHAKKLQDFADLYSLRIGIHHRLLLRRSAEGGVEARDLVTRERHDAVVARYRG